MSERSRALRRLLLIHVLIACSCSTARPPVKNGGVGDAGLAPNMIDPDAGSGGDAALVRGSDAGVAPMDGAGDAAASGDQGGDQGGAGAAAQSGGSAGDHSVYVAGVGGHVASVTGGAGARSEQMSGNGGTGGGVARAGDCGDVVAADHPAFAAIKRLATTQQEVRVLVYGQSISEQAWWSKTKAWLQQTYPNGKLVMEEHAHGGCSSQCLIGHEAYFLDNSQYNRLPEDVFAWKPDLIIFHVYGDHIDYGYIMKGFSQGCSAFDDYKSYDNKVFPQVRCTAEQRAMSLGYKKPEVLIQDDFVISDKQMDCPSQPTTEQWDCFMNDLVIPNNVTQYHYTLQDNFHDFPDYIAAHHLDPSTLIMPDNTHLTEPAGTDVMFALTVPHLCYKP